MVEGAMRVAGGLDGNFCDGRVVATEGMMLFGAFAAKALFCALVAEPAERPTPRDRLGPAFSASARFRAAVMGRLSTLVVARSLVLNTPVAVVCGWLFWRVGIEAAIVAHFMVDIVYHVIGTALLRLNDRVRFLAWIPRPEQ